MQFIEQIKDDADTLVVDADVASKIMDQMRSGDVDVGEFLSGLARDAARQPTGLEPCLQSLGFKAGTIEKLAIVHAEAPVVCCELSPAPGCHWFMNCSSSGSG